MTTESLLPSPRAYQTAVANTDYALFVAPYLTNIEQLRAYMMLPPNPNQTGKAKIGLNPSYDLVQGDYVCGGYQPLGSSLNNNDLMASKGLDYLNSLKGINSTIEANTRMYLAMQWNNTQPPGWACTSIMTQSTWTYQCTDKHELLFGTASPCYQTIISACATAGGSEAFITTYQGVQMIVESGVGGNCLSSGGALNDLAPFINFLWLKGDAASILQARQIFNQTLANWTPTQGTGLSGSIGGCFSTPYGPNPTGGGVARTRDLGFWLNMARATGLWNSSRLAFNVTQQVVNQIWGQQKADGSIAVDYPNSNPAPCGGTSSTYPKDSGESDGLIIAAFDPRVPQWFGKSAVGLTSSFATTPISPIQNQLATFTAYAIGGKSPYSFSWSFGDGATTTGSPATHSYSTLGAYLVSLTTTDSAHATNVYTTRITVLSQSSLQSNFSISATPNTLTLIAGGSSSSILTLSSLNGFSGTISLSSSISNGLVTSLSRKSISLSAGQSKGLVATMNATGNLSPGTYGLSITGISGPLTNAVNLLLTVKANSTMGTILPPIIYLPLSEAIAAGTTLRFTVTASEPNQNRVVTLSTNNLPQGSNFDPATGLFAWTPGSNQPGTYHLNFTATDNGNPPMSQTKTVTVQVSPASNHNCANCSLLPAIPTVLWLLVLGGIVGLIITLTVLTHLTHKELNRHKATRKKSPSSERNHMGA